MNCARALQPSTGIALITVGPRGENQIAVAPGANAALALDEDDHARIRSADVVLTNHEVANAVVIEALRLAHEAGSTAILNPAPARALRISVGACLWRDSSGSSAAATDIPNRLTGSTYRVNA